MTPGYSEPMTVAELAVLWGIGWRKAKSVLRAIPDTIQDGNTWQIPAEKMPPVYHRCRNADCDSLQFSTSDLTRAASGADDAGMAQLLNERDLAILLRISISDLNALVETGGVPYVEIGGHVRFDPAAVRDAIRRASVSNTERKGNTECRL